MLQDKEHKLKSQAWRIFQPVHHMHWKNRFIILSLPQIIVLCAQVGTRPKLMSSIALPQPPPLRVSQPHSSTFATSFPNIMSLQVLNSPFIAEAWMQAAASSSPAPNTAKAGLAVTHGCNGITKLLSPMVWPCLILLPAFVTSATLEVQNK